MKQNERLLVYAVTGFLALILVIAVVFGGDPANAGQKDEKGGTSLSDILNPETGKVADADEAGRKGTEGENPSATGRSRTGLDGPQTTPSEQPLAAKAPSPSVLVQQRIGAYRKEQNVRWVTARPGDSFGTLAVRWCGKQQPYADEAMMLNEDTYTLKAGQPVMVPWVDDEILLTLLDAQQVPTRVPGNPTLLAKQPADNTGATNAEGPGFRSPKVDRSGLVDLPKGGPAADPAAGGVSIAYEVYKVQPGDILWKLLDSRFPTNKVPGLIEKVKKLNPKINTDRLKVGKTIRLPKAAAE